VTTEASQGAEPPALRALVVTSDGAPPEVVDPIVKAIQRVGLSLRLVDLGRAGARRRGAIERVIRTVVSEVAERRLLRELLTHPPEVTLCFDPASASALAALRDDGRSLAPVIAVVPELAPGDDWAGTDADRFVTVDDSAAVDLTDFGIDGVRALAVGPVVSRRFALAAEEDRAALRARFGIKTRSVVCVDVEGRGHDGAQQIALQLALAGRTTTVLFDAGTDREAATALRRQVPTLEMRAKLFGRSPEAPLYWRCADVVVSAPTIRAASNALLLGARFVALAPEGDDQVRLAAALEQRGVASTAKTPLLLASAIEAASAGTGNIRAYAGRDGAGIIAEAAKVVAHDRAGVLAETRAASARYTERAAQHAAATAFAADARAAAEARVSAAPGGLEDIGGIDDEPVEAGGADLGELARRRAEVAASIERAKKRVFEARSAAEQWDTRRGKALADGRDDLAGQAAKAAEAARVRMHDALQELAALEKQSAQLERDAMEAAARSARPPRSPAGGRRAPRPGASVDDMLDGIKKAQGRRAASNLDDELAALKERMKKGSP
jgi:hypothetical protein